MMCGLGPAGRASGVSRRMIRVSRPILIAALAVVAPNRSGIACDVCAIYTATEMQESRTGLRLGVAEQFSRFTTEQDNGHVVPNPYDERLQSSITQVLIGYQVMPRLGFQLAIPIISRIYRRVEDIGVVNGDETGFGDISLLANVLAAKYTDENSVSLLTLFGGLQLPSGNPSKLGEEVNDPRDLPGFPARLSVADGVGSLRPNIGIGTHHDPNGPPSGIHGHDLALGTGSVSIVFGGQLFTSWQRAFLASTLQYVVRTQGAFGYTYADEFTWSGGPGFYALLSHDYTLGIQALVTGETKANDTINGMGTNDTAMTALYLGPGINFTWESSLTAEIGADIPVIQNNAGLQIVPDYRLRGGLVWHF